MLTFHAGDSCSFWHLMHLGLYKKFNLHKMLEKYQFYYNFLIWLTNCLTRNENKSFRWNEFHVVLQSVERWGYVLLNKCLKIVFLMCCYLLKTTCLLCSYKISKSSSCLTCNW